MIVQHQDFFCSIVCKIHFKIISDFFNRHCHTYKIKTAIHLIRKLKSLSFQVFPPRSFFFSVQLKMVTMNMLESSNQENSPGHEHSPFTHSLCYLLSGLNQWVQVNKQTNKPESQDKDFCSCKKKMQLVSSVNEPTQDRLRIKLLCCLVLVNRPNFIHESRDNGFFVHKKKKKTEWAFY